MSGQVQEYLEHLARIGNAFPRYIFFPPLKDKTGKPLPELKGYKATDIKVHSIEEAIDLIHKNKHRMACVSSGVFADTTKGRKNKDVVRVQDIVIDIDSKIKGSDFQTPPDVLKQLESTALKIQNKLHTLGFVDTFVKMSGNGYHIHIPVDIDIVTFTEDPFKLCVKQLYNQLKEYKSDLFKFDEGATSTLNRVWKLPEQQNVKYKLQLQKDVLPNIRCSTFLDKIPFTASSKTTIKTNTELFCQLKDKIQPKQKKIATNPVSRINAQLHSNDSRIDHILTRTFFDKLKQRSEDKSGTDFYALKELQKMYHISCPDELGQLYTLCCEYYGCTEFKWLTRVNDSYRKDTLNNAFDTTYVKQVETKCEFESFTLPEEQEYISKNLFLETQSENKKVGIRSKKKLDRIYEVEWAKGQKEWVVCLENDEDLQDDKMYSFKPLSTVERYGLAGRLPTRFLNSQGKLGLPSNKYGAKQDYNEYIENSCVKWSAKYTEIYRPDTLLPKENLLEMFGTYSINDIIQKHFQTEGRTEVLDTLLKGLVFSFSTKSNPRDVQKYSPHVWLSTNTKTTKTTTAKLYSGVSRALEEASVFFLFGGGNAEKKNTKQGYCHKRNKPVIFDEASDWNVSKDTSKLNAKSYMRDGVVERGKGHSQKCEGTATFVFLQNFELDKNSGQTPNLYTVERFSQRIMKMDEAQCGRFAFIFLDNNLPVPNNTRVKHLRKLEFVFNGISEHSITSFDTLHKNEAVLEWLETPHSNEHKNILDGVKTFLKNSEIECKGVACNIVEGAKLNHESLRGMALRNALCSIPLNTLFDVEHWNNPEHIENLLEVANEEYQELLTLTVESVTQFQEKYVAINEAVITSKFQNLKEWEKVLVHAYYFHFISNCVQAGYVSIKEVENDFKKHTDHTEYTELEGGKCKIVNILNYDTIKKTFLASVVNYLNFENKKYSEMSQIRYRINTVIQTKNEDVNSRKLTHKKVLESLSFIPLIPNSENVYTQTMNENRKFISTFKHWLQQQDTQKLLDSLNIYPLKSVYSVWSVYGITEDSVRIFLNNSLIDIKRERGING